MDEVIDSVCRIERGLVGEHQRLDHMQRSLFVFLKMFRGDMLFISLPARVGFENGHHVPYLWAHTYPLGQFYFLVKFPNDD